VPDVVVFDLDPPEDGGLDDVRAAARTFREELERLGLVPFLQTTGSKGYHVVAPIEPTHGTEGVRAFARALAERVAASDPDRFTVEQRKAKRRGRVFLDTALFLLVILVLLVRPGGLFGRTVGNVHAVEGVSFSLQPEGNRTWCEFTTANVNQPTRTGAECLHSDPSLVDGQHIGLLRVGQVG
jgi:hypothetical protein